MPGTTPSRSTWRWPLLLAALLALGTLLSAPPSAADGPRSERRDEESDRHLREEGWTVDSTSIHSTEVSGTHRLVASGRIASPVESVWALISSPPDQGPTWPSLRDAVTEHAQGDTLVARFIMSVPLYPDRRYRLRSVADHAHLRIDFQMLPGYGNVHQIIGSWQIAPLGDSLTSVVYTVDTDPGVRLVPGFIIKWATRRTIPHLFAFLHHQARQAPPASTRTGSKQTGG